MNDEQLNDFEVVAKTIRKRKTFKVLADVENPVQFTSDPEPHRELVERAIAEAGWAPFHYDRKVDSVAEPWRVHILWHEPCREIAQNMRSWFSDMKPNNKLPSMLSACGALVLVNWLPQSPDEITDPEKLLSTNEEHLAATAAMVQNLLLLLTASGMGTYWSSGGQLKSPEMFRRLGIPATERLSAAVLVEFPESMSQDLERLSGKNREKRSEATQWSRVITELAE